MPTVAGSVSQLLSILEGIVRLEGGRLKVVDAIRLRGDGIRDLAWSAAFTADAATAATAQWMVWEASQALGARSASIHELYMARARGEISGFTVPAINLRAQTFDMARTVFETASAADVGAVILELARSEQTYTFQRPIDFSTAVLAGAIAAGWQGPVFIQGDHYQFNAKKYVADPEAMTEEIRRACRLAIDAGYRNIDIDSSTLVDLSLPTDEEQQRANYERTAELVALIRSLEVDGVTKRSCITPLNAVADGAHVKTLEGLGQPHNPRGLQKAFIDNQAAQCAYCTSGIIMGSYNWLQGRFSAGNRSIPTDDEVKDFLSGVGQTPPFVYLCRCGTHMRIVRAIQQAAKEMK